MWEHGHHPRVLNRVKEPPNIRREDPLDGTSTNRSFYRVEGIMRTAPGSEPIGAVLKVRLIDRRQEPVHRSLQKAVFYFRDAERSLFGRLSGFRDIDATNRGHAVGMGLEGLNERGDALSPHGAIGLPGFSG